MDRGKDRPSIWWRTERGSGRPDPGLDHAAIAAAAVALADAGGLDAVSMRAVAGRSAQRECALPLRRRQVRSARSDGRLSGLGTAAVPSAGPGLAGGDAPARRSPTGAARAASLVDHTGLPFVQHRAGESRLLRCLFSALIPTETPVRAKFEAIALMTGLAALFAQRAQSEESGALTPLPASALEAFHTSPMRWHNRRHHPSATTCSSAPSAACSGATRRRDSSTGPTEQAFRSRMSRQPPLPRSWDRPAPHGDDDFRGGVDATDPSRWVPRRGRPATEPD